MTAIRSPAVAGTFYPADPAVLRRQIADFLSDADNAPPAGTTPPKAIIGPHAGYIYSGPVAARAYARLAGARGRIRRVVLIGPSHYVGFQGLAVDTAQAWSMPNGTVQLDAEAIAAIRRLPMVGELDAAYTREHALEVHVPFLQHVLGDFRLVPIVAGDAPPDAVAAVFDALWGGPETLFVVSTDLSHYLGVRRLPAHGQRHRRRHRTLRHRRHHPDRCLRRGPHPRPAARCRPPRHGHRAPRPAQFRRHRRPARPRRRLRRLGAARAGRTS